MACYGDSFTFSYIDGVRTSQDTHLRASTACYGDTFTFLCVDDVRTSQETHASMACYGDSFTFCFVDGVSTSQDTHLWASTARYGYSFTFPLSFGSKSVRGAGCELGEKDSEKISPKIWQFSDKVTSDDAILYHNSA
jgi:hypothetical protein